MTLQKDPEGNEQKILHQFADFANKRVLEIGCSEGRLTWKYAKSAQGVTGIDLDKDGLRVATIDRPSDLPVSFAQADSTRLPFVNKTFDIANADACVRIRVKMLITRWRKN